MKLEQQLAGGLLAGHPAEAARALETLGPAAAAGLVGAAPEAAAAAALRAMAPAAAAAVIAALPPQRAARPVGSLPVDHAALLLRRVDASARSALLEELPARVARAVGALLHFPEDTAGALMDPDVLAVPEELTAREALARVRAAAQHARYNVYALDREQLLVGVVNLRELLMARPSDPLARLMTRSVQRLTAHADRRAIVAHPGWREVHALPVVDERGRYLGALRYRTLRRIEEQLRRDGGEPDVTAQALGELFRAAAAGLLEAVTAGPRVGVGPMDPELRRRDVDGT